MRGTPGVVEGSAEAAPPAATAAAADRGTRILQLRATDPLFSYAEIGRMLRPRVSAQRAHEIYRATVAAAFQRAAPRVEPGTSAVGAPGKARAADPERRAAGGARRRNEVMP